MIRLGQTVVWACLPLAGCSLEKRGTGDDLALVQDSDLADTVIAADSSPEPDTLAAEDTSVPIDTSTDTTVAEADVAPPDTSSDLGVDAGPISITCTDLALDTEVDLTATGKLAWGHYGFADAATFTHRAGDFSISAATLVKGAATRYSAYPVSFTWNDGVPTTSATKTKTGIYVSASGGGFEVDVAGDGAIHKYRLYLGSGSSSVATLSVLTAATSATVPITASTFTTQPKVCEVIYGTSSSLKFRLLQSTGGYLSLLALTVE